MMHDGDVTCSTSRIGKIIGLSVFERREELVKNDTLNFVFKLTL